MLDIQKFVDGLHGYIGQALAPITARLKALEDSKPSDPTALIELAVQRALLDLDRRAADMVQRRLDSIPAPEPGKDGRDALDLEDFDLTLGEDERTVTMSLRRGETVIEKTIKFPTMKYMGVFHEKAAYERHDAVTYGGGIWIAKKDNPEGAPGLSEDFQLAVKRGRDGKESVSIPRDPSKPVQI